MRRSHPRYAIVVVVVAASVLGGATPAFAQRASHPADPLALSLTMSGDFSTYVGQAIAAAISNEDQPTYTCTPAFSLGGQVGYDIYRTPNRQDPILFSLYYEYVSVASQYATTLGAGQGSSTTADPGSLTGYGPGLQARVYFGDRSRDDPASRLHSVYLSASAGYYHLFGALSATGAGGAVTTQYASTVAFGTRLAIGGEIPGRMEVNLGVGLFPGMGIRGFTANTPVLLTAGTRF